MNQPGINPKTLQRLRHKQHQSQSQQQHKLLLQRTARTLPLSSLVFDPTSAFQRHQLTKQNPSKLKVVDQKSSGRCWLFAALNLIRHQSAPKLGREQEFELSAAYLMFYDKLEKSVLFLHNIWKTRDKSIDSRAVQHLLQNPPVSDGGQFSMFLDLVEKYGCVPVEVYPDSVHASRTKELNELLATILRYFAKQVRQSENEVNFQKLVNQAVHTVYELLTCALGSPPEEFEFNSQKFTPLQFYRNVLEPRDLDEYVVLVNVPQSDRPMNQPYEVSSLGSMVGGRAVRYLNVDLETMIFCVTQTLDMDLRVWFGSFVNDCRHEKEGLLDTEAFDCGYQVLLGLDVCLDRSERLRYRQSAVTHAMVFSGYHVDAATGRAKSFRVENSWGPTHKEGYFDMTRKWFERNVYEVAVPPSVVPADLLRLWLSGKPRELPMWDPLGMLLGPECC